MSANFKRPGPDAYDHLWTLLPVFVAFLIVIAFAGAAAEHPLQAGQAIEFDALPAATDASVPAPEAAMPRLPDAVAEPVATF